MTDTLLPLGTVPLRTRIVSPLTLDAATHAAWVDLEARATEPNAYLSPHFALPALRHLDPKLNTRLVLAELASGPRAGTLVGLALVHAAAPNKTLPLPHARAYASIHSFLGHWLLDRECAPDAALQLLRGVKQALPWATAVILPECPTESEHTRALRSAAHEIGSEVHVTNARPRAMLQPRQGGPELLRAQMGRKKYAEIERSRRRLQERGALEWRVLRENVQDPQIETFLELEHMGWKREAGTSLRSNPADEAFFREMSRNFVLDGRALFTELLLDGKTVVTLASYVSGTSGFAFKVGWDEPMRTFGVGILNAADLVLHAPEVCSDLDWFDSGAQPGSFLDGLWPDRREMGTLIVPLNSAGRLVWRMRQTLMKWKRGLVAPPAPSA